MAHGKTGHEQQGGQERPFRLQHCLAGLDRVHRLVTSKPLAAACAPSLDCQHKNCALRLAPRSTIEVGALAIIALSVAALAFVQFSVR
jgi:hypothetical protein